MSRIDVGESQAPCRRHQQDAGPQTPVPATSYRYDREGRWPVSMSRSDTSCGQAATGAGSAAEPSVRGLSRHPAELGRPVESSGGSYARAGRNSIGRQSDTFVRVASGHRGGGREGASRQSDDHGGRVVSALRNIEYSLICASGPPTTTSPWLSNHAWATNSPSSPFLTPI